MGLFDWLRGRRSSAASTFTVTREGSELVVEPARGSAIRLPLGGVRAVRIVPLTGGDHHMQQGRGGWQVALQRPDGDVLVGSPLQDWRAARELAQRVCEAAGLPLDELTERMFSRVGQFGQSSGR